ncbi:MAG TPA: hypothetical protein VJW77_02480, partial [Terriglobia bacterium]|nr:hypothetical protein [Terriglobia bacterium]
DPSRSDFKASARKYLERADALVTIGPAACNHSWRDVDAGILGRKPAFQLAHPGQLSDELVEFVRQQLALDGAP